jgi:hypothetical protein
MQEHQHKKVKTEGTSFRSRCIEKFDLLLVPDDWNLSEKLLVEINDEQAWEKYLTYRNEKQKHQKKQVIKPEDDCSEEDEGDEEPWDSWEQDLTNDWIDKLNETAKDVKYEAWLNHVCLHLNSNWEDEDTLRSAEYQCEIFSPYAIPRAIELEHQFHERGRMYSAEFGVKWEFKLVRFDGEDNGDYVTEMYKDLWPSGRYFVDALYNASSGQELLCGNYYKHPPPYKDNEDVSLNCWTAVERINVKNFTPLTVKRMRRWIFGASLTPTGLSDFDFLRLALASMATPNFSTLNGHVGHEWDPRDSGFIDQTRGLPSSVTWLEYQSRLVTQTLRPGCDEYYEPYNELGAKGNWGMNVLDNIEEEENDDSETEDERENMRKAPWLIWEEAEKRRGIPSITKCLEFMQLFANMREDRATRRVMNVIE